MGDEFEMMIQLLETLTAKESTGKDAENTKKKLDTAVNDVIQLLGIDELNKTDVLTNLQEPEKPKIIIENKKSLTIEGLHKVCKEILGDNYWFDDKNYQLILKFDKFIITDGSLTQPITDLYIKIQFNDKNLKSISTSLYCIRLTATFKEVMSGYVHSHAGSNSNKKENYCTWRPMCLGGGTPLNKAIGDLAIKPTEKTLFNVLMGIIGWTTWESREGGPYYRLNDFRQFDVRNVVSSGITQGPESIMESQIISLIDRLIRIYPDFLTNFEFSNISSFVSTIEKLMLKFSKEFLIFKSNKEITDRYKESSYYAFELINLLKKIVLVKDLQNRQINLRRFLTSNTSDNDIVSIYKSVKNSLSRKSIIFNNKNIYFKMIEDPQLESGKVSEAFDLKELNLFLHEGTKSSIEGLLLRNFKNKQKQIKHYEYWS